MTVITDRVAERGEGEALRVWRCASCRCFHLRAGEVLLTLTPEEFAEFTREVTDCYCVQMLPAEVVGLNPLGQSVL
ncbi:MAG: hypothetical protein ABW208_16335 [Pyrinomonadaceae bacterium]